ncbi:L-type lectin-domain containing receptor kinase IV.1-like isoform X1 [Rhodamnia argentea]|uniref:non-specific serine/threonine protein kinase n=1 Tax=Rhodamnia argentea TaxID=178133 RepID=A0A8B8Q5S6_9MYRT|nr:L-type lectin-domain containing receptor kinase IV.1-like isoform X1 [Rhodamnia argentea]
MPVETGNNLRLSANHRNEHSQDHCLENNNNRGRGRLGLHTTFQYLHDLTAGSLAEVALDSILIIGGDSLDIFSVVYSAKFPLLLDMFFLIVLVASRLVNFALAQDTSSFTYNGFRSANLSLDGLAAFTGNGLLKLTNATKQKQSHAFYPDPIKFKSSANGSVYSFSTMFVFGMVYEYPPLGGYGFAFVLAPRREFPGALPSYYFGLFNETDNGNSSNHIVAVEFDTIQNHEFNDINDNHVGIDVNGLTSVKSALAGYTASPGAVFTNLSLMSGKAMQVWVHYDGSQKQFNVTLSPIDVEKPKTPLLSLSIDLSPIIMETMYVGFSSSTGSLVTSHYIVGWSFKVNGEAQGLVLSQLPRLPRVRKEEKSYLLTVGVPFMVLSFLSMLIFAMVYLIRRKRKFAEVLEDWERDYGPHRFEYKDLYVATKGFRDQELLGAGGFGRVYRGVLPTTKTEIAVKRVTHESRQGMREFVAEIISIGRLRHRNIVTLLGYCRRKGELLLVYDYMPHGSLDKYLYNQPKVTLNWSQRFRVIKGVAYGLSYLHEGWERVVIHRDIKASNILLDSELNGRLGDFGLARIYDHGTDPQTTHVVGTLGYLAPENTRTARATTSTDVFAFGAFLLEVACGRRPIEAREKEDVILVEWVFSCWDKGDILEARDPNLGTDFVAKEVELVLKLGLMCSNSERTARPRMRHVVQYLEGDVTMQELSSLGTSTSGLTFAGHEGLSMSYPSSADKGFSQTSPVPDSLLSGGR